MSGLEKDTKPNMRSPVKIIAMYFTQLHAIPENDEWWGMGFTDWDNVRKAKPLFEGHYQPRVPLDAVYYDQSRIETIRNQVKLAKNYGIYGFCHYHYWFDGKQLLETPTNLWLANTDVDFPFCLSWANETWSRRWDGRDHQILIKQTHPPTKQSWSRHFDYLINIWRDERAIKIDGKPVFVIYRPQKIQKIGNMLEYWNQQAKKSGLKGIYFIYQQQYRLHDDRSLRSFNTRFRFEPFNSIYSQGYSSKSANKSRLRALIDKFPTRVQGLIWSIWNLRQQSASRHDYDTVWRQIIDEVQKSPSKELPGAFVDWDNTARYGERATIIEGASPERFRYWFRILIDTLSTRPADTNFLFFNAWNEWSECAYLEPDLRYGHEYLQIVKETLDAQLGGR